MLKCCVLFAAQAELLNIIFSSSRFKGLYTKILSFHADVTIGDLGC
jgi:hypothetical protein